MIKMRHTEEQIIGAIKEHEAGAKVDDLCRKLGISSGTFYNWRSKYASALRCVYRRSICIDLCPLIAATSWPDRPASTSRLTASWHRS